MEYAPPLNTSRWVPDSFYEDRPTYNELPGDPLAPNTSMNRFCPKHWVIEVSPDAAAAIIPKSDTSFEIPVEWRTKRDKVRVIWDSDDSLSHVLFRYSTNTNYKDLILAFRHNPADPTNFVATVSTVTDLREFSQPLIPYLFDEQTQTYRAAVNNPASFPTYPSNVIGPVRDVIPPELMVPVRNRIDYIYILDFNRIGAVNVDQVSLTCLAPGYNPDSLAVVPRAEGRLYFTDLTMSGGVQTLGKCFYPNSPAGMSMETNYDHIYQMTPDRVVSTALNLGFEKNWLFRIGSRNYFKAEGNRVVESVAPINAPAREYINRFLDLAKEKFNVVFGVHHRLHPSFIPNEWAQVDYAVKKLDSIRPNSLEAMDYLASVHADLAQLQADKSMEQATAVMYPGWVADTSQPPGIYDTETRMQYLDETGMPVPMPLLYSVYAPATTLQRYYLSWLQRKMDAGIAHLRAAIPHKVLISLSVSDMVDPVSDITDLLQKVPASWFHPQWDGIIISDSSWLTYSKINNVVRTVPTVTDMLRYPPERIHYTLGRAPSWELRDLALANISSTLVDKVYPGTFADLVQNNVTVVWRGGCGCPDKDLTDIDALRDTLNDLLRDTTHDPLLGATGDQMRDTTSDALMDYDGQKWEAEDETE